MRVPFDPPPGVFTNDTTFAKAGRWSDCDNMRFVDGKAQARGGWESVVATLLSGVCRSVFSWTDNLGTPTLAFGTHATLELYQGGGLYDITPTLSMPPKTLTAPYTVVDASTTVTINHPSHGLTTADTVVISGGDYVGRILPTGTEAVTVVDDDTYTIVHGSAADTAVTLANNPFTTTTSSVVVTVADTAHKIADGTLVTFSGATAVGGITPNGTFAITVVNANSYTFNFTSAATSGATGGGAAVVATVPTTGGGSVTITPQNAFAAGQIDGTGTVGWSTGAYGVGAYGSPSTTEYYPRTWSFGAWGQQLVGSYRGGTIYAWANDTGVVAAPISNAPRQVTHMLVASQDQVFALGCNEELSGVFNPLTIRHCSVRDYSEWTTGNTTTAREYTLPGGGNIICGTTIGDNLLIWTTHSLFLGTYVGQFNQVWRFDRIGRNCGIIGRGAATVISQTAYWISPDRQFWAYSLGGVPTPIDCPLRAEFAEYLAAAQSDKIVASTVSEYSEVRWDYPDSRDGYENSRYLVLKVSGTDAGAWSKGVQARTAMVDAGPSPYPCGVTYEGSVYWHERGQSADGSAMSWFIETCDLYLSEERTATLLEIYPDFKGQVGGVTITDTYRFEAQGDEYSQAVSTISTGDVKADIRATGRLHKLRFEGSSAPASVRFGKIMLEAKAGGKR